MRAFLRFLRLAAIIAAVVVLLLAVAGGWFYWRLHRSLPQLDGTAPLPGLSARVTVTRDALGVPTIQGATRLDVARALGYLHAQDRFFQMDLLRRSAAGELSELIGSATIELDKLHRVHGFRRSAHATFAASAPAQRDLLEAYAAGVNAGLAALRSRPFEYLVFRAQPQPWLPEDSLLVGYAMMLDLQGDHGTGRYERTLTALRDQLGGEAVSFFAPTLTPTDAALDGTTAPLAPIPSARVIDLRRRAVAAALPAREDPLLPGSNSFALSGAHTTTGAALLANDTHLGLSVPNTWYRASLTWPGASGAPAHHVTGVTLPGTPLVVAGSNGHVAWGFTHSYADTTDVVIVEPNGIADFLYKVGDKSVDFEHRHEVIRVRGGKPVALDVAWTVWGPVIGTAANTRPLALRWVAHEPHAVDLTLVEMETATTAAEGVAIMQRAGLPPENVLLADAQGHIAWTVAGKFPKRVGFDGRYDVSWTYGDRRWDGFYSAAETPSLLDPPDGRLWTANNRVVGGAGLAVLGDGGYANPARAAQIRDDLRALDHAQPRDLLNIQLDDRAVFLARWHALLLRVLTPDATAAQPARAELRRLVEKWDDRASTDSVSYRLVRAFRNATAALVLDPIFAPCTRSYDAFDWHELPYEPALWRLLEAQPVHLLNPKFHRWDDLLTAAADQVLARLDDQGVAPAHATWGALNTARIRHPLSLVLPGWLTGWLTGWLDMPADQLPGDTNMPRVQGPSFGASERFVVSPGHEAEGIFHMPGGESGHPLSPFYRAGHEAWVHGKPTPFLPGPAQHTLTLTP
ncbi:penicillin acylase family protein [Horticoccus luteus]|uniref:Penicillin acylase family protein n=1 Tax=Horticoccus luteus TaxID=2862869 RepID=A0A8F9XGV2_9BACT|nr:penicillin acylase family protein [Horticoccus luteus]QYM78640.1 penicillin acylase family protein [Horticoccus luteus]